MPKRSKQPYDAVIVGAGITGAALAYVLSHYSGLRSFAVIERRSTAGAVNTHHTQNSQTLHFGDIETNYTLEKAARVKQDADYMASYIERHRDRNLFRLCNKMVLAVGDEEVAGLKKRYDTFKKLFPRTLWADRDEIAKREPSIVRDRPDNIPLGAIVSEDGYIVDYGRTAESMLEDAQSSGKRIDVFYGEQVNNIQRVGNNYAFYTDKRTLVGRTGLVSAGADSLRMAKRLGYARHLGVLPVAGSFFCADNVLRGKVYTLQIEGLPFAAVHGDPDVHKPSETRFGPTAKALPLLERRDWGTLFSFLATSVWTPRGIFSLFKILFDPVIFKFVVKNFLIDLPVIGPRIFIRDIQKIAPWMRAGDIKRGKGFGGIRPQVVNTKTMKLEMGEAQIEGDRIIFNITPSPGASSALGNALKNAQTMCSWCNIGFDLKGFERDHARSA